jgi:hypothetical protein
MTSNQCDIVLKGRAFHPSTRFGTQEGKAVAPFGILVIAVTQNAKISRKAQGMAVGYSPFEYCG